MARRQVRRYHHQKSKQWSYRMTVSSSTDRATFAGNGVATVFSLPFRFFANSDVVAQAIVDLTGVATPLTLGIDYTLTGAGQPEEAGAATGVLTTTAPVPAGVSLFVRRIIPATQPTDIVNQGRFFPEVHETVFDRLTMLAQQNEASLDRALRVQEFDPVPDRLPSAVSRALKIMSFDENGNPVAIDAARESALALRQDLADSTDPLKGASLVGYKGRTVSERLSSIYHVRDFGAAGDGVTDDIASFDAAIAAIQANGGGILDTGGDDNPNYLISRPWKLTERLHIIGNGRIFAGPGFSSSVIFPTYITGVPQLYDCLAYFNRGTLADDPNNFGWNGLEIDSSVIFDGMYLCDNGLIMEGLTDFRINGRFTQFESLGVYPKYYCWGGKVGSYVLNCRGSFLKLGQASNGISLDGFRGYGQNDTPTYGIIIDGDNNGVSLEGAFVEKCVNQILITGNPGPMVISGVDFEVCSGTAIHVDGTGLVGRAAGPVTVQGSFLEAGVECIRATNAIVIASGNRIRSTPLAFKAVGGAARIYDIANVIEASVVKIAEGSVVRDVAAEAARAIKTTIPWGDPTPKTTFALENLTYFYNENLPTSFLTFSTAMTDGGLQRQLTSSSWVTREMRSGAVFGELGLTLDYAAGLKNITPYTAGDTSLGTLAKPFDRVYGEALVQCAGVAVGVNPLANGELVMQFTSNTQVTIKGMGSDGVVRIANITLA
jgi:hypothetical protein